MTPPRRSGGAGHRHRARKVRGASAVGRRFEVEVGPIAHGGHCVARVWTGAAAESLVVFVRHALPGEQVVVEITEGTEGDRFWRGDAVEVIRPSRDRVPAPCAFAGPGRCGGCDFQHVELGAQRRLKSAVVREQLRRLAGLDVDVDVEHVPNPLVEEVAHAPGPPLVEEVAHAPGPPLVEEVAHAPGPPLVEEVARAPRSPLVEEVAHAPGPPLVEEVTRAARSPLVEEVAHAPGPPLVEEVAQQPSRDQGLRWRTRQRYLTLPDGGRGMRKHRSHDVIPVDECLLEAPAGPSYDVRGRRFEVADGGFWQVHPGAPEALVDAVLEALRPEPGESALDLYAGVGLFSRFLLEAVGPDGRVAAVEGDPSASALSERNCPRLQATAGDVATVLDGGLDPVWDSADLIVLDPPRAGARRAVVEQVVARSPRAVAYVACDPAALARDVAIFAEHGYSLSTLRAFDLFPMTHHVECVALLEKTGSDLRRSDMR